MAAVTLLGVLMGMRAPAAEVSHFVSDGRLGVSIKALPFPASLAKDLNSGLTNRIVIRLTLLLESQTVGQETVEVDVKYDLWDEQFRVVTTVHALVQSVEKLSSVAEVLGRLGDMRFAGLFPLRDLPVGKYRLRADTLLNPIEKERLEQLRRWVAENSTQTGRLHPGSGDPAAPISGDMLDRIFDLYIKGEGVLAAWHLELLSEPFTADELSHAGH